MLQAASKYKFYCLGFPTSANECVMYVYQDMACACESSHRDEVNVAAAVLGDLDAVDAWNVCVHVIVHP